MSNFKILKSERKHNGKIFNLIVDEIEYASGNRAVHEVAEHPGGAVAVPVMDDGTLLLVRQYRYPIQKYILELPAGKLSPGEDPQLCAARELEEETGYSAEKLTKLTGIYTTPGFCTELLHIYLAEGLKKSPAGQQLEEGEWSLTLERVPFAKAVAMIEKGEIVDGKSICGILLAEKILKQ
ncbi:MAG: NUDIX hydrolase [Ignavibacteriae bacterium]|nr:NUDIX hydrolase [Ignavibacteriota bacterium]